MNVCFLIGNGFDLAIGLKTDYRSFISKYLSDNSNPPDESVEWLINTIKQDIDTWGDAEIAFAQLPFAESGKDSYTTYRNCEEHFSISFQNYLQSQNDRFFIPKEDRKKTRTAFVQHFLQLSSWMTMGHIDQYKVAKNDSEISINFINFNYTNTLAQILGEDVEEPIVQRVADREYKVILDSIIQVHGSLSDGVLFGIDEPNQIADQNVRNHCSRSGETIKPKGASAAGYAARNIGWAKLSEADVIVSFGLSFGKSDLSWWRHLWNCIFGGKNAQMIICPYSVRWPADILGNRLIRVYVDEKKKVFHSFASIHDEAALESATSDSFIVLRPMPNTEHPYDYFHLSDYGDEYLDKQGNREA